MTSSCGDNLRIIAIDDVFLTDLALGAGFVFSEEGSAETNGSDWN